LNGEIHIATGRVYNKIKSDTIITAATIAISWGLNNNACIDRRRKINIISNSCTGLCLKLAEK
jgi:hypothetical protein